MLSRSARGNQSLYYFVSACALEVRLFLSVTESERWELLNFFPLAELNRSNVDPPKLARSSKETNDVIDAFRFNR